MDIFLALNATKPATAEFCGRTFNLNVYTAGRNRLPTEVNAAVRLIADEPDLDDYSKMVRSLRLMFPHVIESWDVTVDGQPLEMQGVRFEQLVTDSLLFEISTVCNEVWADPMSAVESSITTAAVPSEQLRMQAEN